MKMNYHLQSSFKKRSGWSKFFLTVITIVIVSSFLGRIGPTFLRPVFNLMAAPIWQIENLLVKSFVVLFPGLKSKSSLIDENNKLRGQLNDANLSLAEKDLLEKEVLELKRLLNKPIIEENFVTAEILAKPNISIYDTFILKAGKKQGIREGDLVVAGTSMVLGIIITADRNTSTAKLFSSPGERTNVVLPSGEVVPAEGKGGGNFEIRLPRDITIGNGEMVRLGSSSGKIVGVVEEIEVHPSDFFQTVRLRSPVNIFQLKLVSILIK